MCGRCGRRRSERREVLAELLETEVRYGRDLRVLHDELYKPLLVAGLVPLRQLGTTSTCIDDVVIDVHRLGLFHSLDHEIPVDLTRLENWLFVSFI